MTQQIQTNDITTRLLAQENLLIQRAPVSTASFDVVNRVLTLPQWQNMTPEIEEMLKAHEVSHALYTDFEIFEKCKENETRRGIPHGFMNVLEDARIEKLMKRKYPGLRSVFNKGYKQLNERDFFGVKQNDISSLQLIDKINLYYKAGFECGVKFTPAEKYLVDQVSRLETIEDVVTLARKVYDFTKKQKQDLMKQLSQDEGFKKMLEEKQKEQEEDDFYESMDSEYDDDYFDDEENRHEYDTKDFEESEETTSDRKDLTGHGSGTDEQETTVSNDEIKDPVTMKNFEEKLAESADVNTQYVYVDMVRIGEFANDIIIPYKKVLADNADCVNQYLTKMNNMGYTTRAEQLSDQLGSFTADYDKFMTETNRVVSYLIKEFEMRKAATDYKRVQIAKSGILDPRKLAQFKIREDLFKSVAITKDGKKHGLLFVLDWSGSMSDYLTDTVKQLISLVLFCHRVKIPFQVFAFSDVVNLRKQNMTQEEINQRENTQQKIITDQATNVLNIDPRFNMIEFFSNKMTNSDLMKMCKTIFTMSYGFYSDGYELNGTPLNESLAFLYDYSEKFIKSNQIEKFTLIKLTDGDGGRVYGYKTKCGQSSSDYDKKLGYVTQHFNRGYDWDGNRKIRYVYFLRCPVTKKVYSIDYNTQWGNLLTQMIKDRYKCGSIGFHVTDKRSREINYAMATYNVQTSDTTVYQVRRDLIKEGFCGLEVYGHDELFLLKTDHKVAEEELTDDMTKMSAAAIAKQFSKHLSAKKTSRVLLNRFVGVVA